MSRTSESMAEDLVMTFWAVIDEIRDTPGDSLFHPDGQLQIETLQVRGQAELRQYFADRRAKSLERSRMTRHVVSNLRHGTGPDGAQIVDCLVTVFSGYGPRPAPLGAPSSLADFTFVCRMDAQDRPLLDRVSGRLIMAGADTPDLGKGGGDHG